MEYYERLQAAINYIEQNLTEDMSIGEVAHAACWSKYHFQRIFHSTTGATIFDYIQKRRLTESANDLLHSNNKILSIALKYGFNSHETYIRAFKRMFQLSPNQFRKEKRAPVLKTVSPFTPNSILERRDLENLFSGFTTEPAKTLWGYKYDGTEQEKILKLWQKIMPLSIGNRELHPVGILQYPEKFDLDVSFSYAVAIEQKVEESLMAIKIPHVNYAVFNFVGAVQTLPEIYQYIYAFWLDKEKLLNKFGFDCECYPQQFYGMESNRNVIQIKVPVISQ